MCKVLTDYGAVATHGSRELKLQIITIDKETKSLALVTYKDGMSVSNKIFTREEAEKMKSLLEGYLDYKAPVKESKPDTVETEDQVIKVLTTLPALDGNYTSVLKLANKEQIEEAIRLMKESGGRHGTRIKACENALRRLAKGDTAEDKTEDKPKAETKETKAEKKLEPKVVQFPSEDKKPVIIPLKTEGDRTYGECVAKIQKELEVFGSDSDSQYVLQGVLELCKVDGDFRNNFMREDKSYSGFMEYMYNAAKNGYCTRYGNVGWLDRDKGLALAIDYYNHDEVKQKEIDEAKRKKEAEERKAKAEANKTTKKGGKNGSNNSKKKGRTSA